MAFPAVILEFVPTVFWKVTSPVEVFWILIAAPIPSPRLLTAPVNVAVPDPALISKSKGPVNVSLNNILPAPLPVSSVTPPESVVALVKVILSLVVVMSPAVVNRPVLLAPKITVPPDEISPLAVIVVSPVASISIVPLVAVVIPALISNVPPASISIAPVVESIAAASVTLPVWFIVSEPAPVDIVPPVLSKLTPVLENAPPLVSIVALISTLPVALNVRPSAPTVEEIPALIIMSFKAVSVSVAAPPAVLVIAVDTVILPASPFVPADAVVTSTEVPAFKAVVIRSTPN